VAQERAGDIPGLPRLLGVLVAGTAAAVAAALLSAGALRQLAGHGVRWEERPLDELLTTVASCALTLCCLWIAAVLAATAVEVATGCSARVVQALTPRAVRRTVLACCGIAVSTATIVSPAAAHESPPGASRQRVGTPPAVHGATLVGLPLPDRTSGVLPLHEPRRVHRVRPGDCLWTVAEDLLRAPARPAAVDRAWRALYRANRTVIGEDPDVLLPGTALELVPISPARAGVPPRPTPPPRRKDMR